MSDRRELGAGEQPLNVWAYLRPARRGVAAIAVLSLLAAQMEAVALVLLVPIAQALSEGRSRLSLDMGPVEVDVTVRQASLMSLSLVIVTYVLTIVLARIRAGLMARWERRERDRLLRSYMAADWSVQVAVKAGRIQGLSNFATRGGNLLGAVASGIRGVMSVLMFLALAFVVDWRAAVLVSVVGLALFGILRPLSRRIRAQNRRMTREQLRYSEDVAETAAMSREVRVFGAWEAFERRLLDRSAALQDTKHRTQFLSQCLAPTYQYGGLLVIVGVLLFASEMDTLDVGQLGAIAVLMLRSLNFSNQIQSAWQTILDSTPFLEKLQAAEAEFSSVEASAGVVDLPSVSSVELRSVSYRYQGDGDDAEMALTEVDLSLKRGEVVGIVGPSGAGKSTLVQILLRLRRPTSGAVFVNDRPSDEATLASWYQHVSLVPQTNMLFHGTVEENLGFLDANLGLAELELAARRAHVHDVITALHDGYQTQIGPTTRDLSGGQIQRIGIARAFVRQPDMLVLDEPTSALDVHSEQEVHQALREAAEEMIIVVIAHRISTLSICDRIVVVEGGRVTADGPMAEIAGSSEFFRKALSVGSLGFDEPSEAHAVDLTVG